MKQPLDQALVQHHAGFQQHAPVDNDIVGQNHPGFQIFGRQ